jgi:hypothetical protein
MTDQLTHRLNQILPKLAKPFVRKPVRYVYCRITGLAFSTIESRSLRKPNAKNGCLLLRSVL